MNKRYQNLAIAQLCDQLRFTPPKVQYEETLRAERLIEELLPEKEYSFEYLYFRITGQRPDKTEIILIHGRDAIHDLRIFIEDLSFLACIPVNEAGETVHTIQDLSKRFQVATKTISRWREQGLIARRFLYNGRKRLGFLDSSIERFLVKNKEQVLRSERFRQLSYQEKNNIAQSARHLAHAGYKFSEVTKRLGKELGRSTETIRYTLKEYDKKNPRIAIFPNQNDSLSHEGKRSIYEQYHSGESVKNLSDRFQRTPSSIYRILSEIRTEHVLQLPLDYMDSDEFAAATTDDDLDAEILSELLLPQEKENKVRPPSNLPPYLAALYQTPLLNRQQEAHLFRKYNYLKFKASKLRQGAEEAQAAEPGAWQASRQKGDVPAEEGSSAVTRKPLTKQVLDEIESLYQQAIKVKNQILKANLRLVVSVAKKHSAANRGFFTLISDGNMSLIRAIEKFNYTLGNKFSTYATWAIMKNFARSIPAELKHQDRFRNTADETFQFKEDFRANAAKQEAENRVREQQIGNMLHYLDKREQQIIIHRFGLNYQEEPKTLQEVGKILEVTKERVRQIEARALNKLRVAAKKEKIDPE
ncbi:MAG: sigma-70 family RNA polymerase sigma factor [Pirellulaceae bacterium]|nr:sigma-70 family RNA polymerase sigma factor [Pirellulaceae bacterium]